MRLRRLIAAHLPIYRLPGEVEPDSIVYTDTFKAYNVLDLGCFHHHRINHSKFFAERWTHINGIENFWNQAKRHQAKTFLLAPERV